ncbi:MAG: single-stranded DNA-binding protein [Verrucomicrobia bacterium]|nr:single-stranded DNA-binding protein [Verrucomicrobiota bacterium]
MADAVLDAMLQAAQDLSDGVDGLDFAAPTEVVYNPLRYAWAAHEQYLRLHASEKKRVIFLGMNPGPFGMAQCGVPFGEIALVRDWVGVDAPVAQPPVVHPKRPIEGFACTRSEVSGRRLWGAFKERFGMAEAFFKDHFVANYCPLVFMEASGKNRTPDKLPASEKAALEAHCSAHLRAIVKALDPEWLIGVGAFAEQQAAEALADQGTRIGRILHPSPASPAANRGWAEQATAQLEVLGIW